MNAGEWTRPGRLPPPGQFCFESLQVACYQPGQHFLQHEVNTGQLLTAIVVISMMNMRITVVVRLHESMQPCYHLVQHSPST